jgi:alpha-methylacyl-CoA racemase
MADASPGPLSGIRVVELAGIGPGPFCAMLLADMGAEIIRVDRVGTASADYTPNPVIERGRKSIALNLKSEDGREVLMRLVTRSDVLIESFRPGVAERLGIGPEQVAEVNPRLIYGRLTGWGQWGPMSSVAGHDINYIGLTGALHSIGRHDGPPLAPLNLVGDFGGGASSLAFGIACALVERATSGMGQVIDANVLDGTTTLMALIHGLRAQGKWSGDRGANLLDTGCPYYDVYTCADGKWMAIGTIEEKFFRSALRLLGLDGQERLLRGHKDRSIWPELRTALTEAFASRTRDEWVDIFALEDTCVTPVLDMDEAIAHPHALDRGLYAPIPGQPDSRAVQPAVAPRFSRSSTPVPGPAVTAGSHTGEILSALGYAPEQMARLFAGGAAAFSPE